MEHCAVIFDWDGVVVDSRDFHDRSWRQMALEQGYELPDDYFTHCFGMRNQETIMDYLKWTQDGEVVSQLAHRKEVIYRELLSQYGIAPLVGVRDFLSMLRENKIVHAVATSSGRLNIDCALAAMQLENAFDAICTSEHVSAGKPAPDIFLYAASCLGKKPSECVVIEDAPVGITAAQKAGMAVIAITNSHGAAQLQEASMVVDRIGEITQADLMRLTGYAHA